MRVTPIERRFQENAVSGFGALLPYFTSAYPDAATTVEMIQRADRLGVTSVEIGVPDSDSIADGPVIQASFRAVLARGHRLQDTFRMASQVRPSVRCGLVAMVSHAIVHRRGVDAFMHEAAEAGFDRMILPDVPVEESGPMSAAARRAGLCHIGLVAPTTSPPGARPSPPRHRVSSIKSRPRVQRVNVRRCPPVCRTTWRSFDGLADYPCA